MKLYTIFTPSHKILYENFFLKTLPGEFELIAMEIPQISETGEFYKTGWDKTCYKKVEFFLKACEENIGNVFVYSDVDVQFFSNIKNVLLKELGKFDIACHNDTGTVYSSGFFICRANDKTLNMFKAMKENYADEDQKTLNRYIHMVKSKYLSKKFFTIGHITNSVWEAQDFEMPDKILVHHADYTVGVENKIKLMQLVREKVDKSR